MGEPVGIDQTTLDILAALLIYDAGRTFLRLVLVALRDRLRDDGRA